MCTPLLFIDSQFNFTGSPELCSRANGPLFRAFLAVQPDCHASNSVCLLCSHMLNQHRNDGITFHPAYLDSFALVSCCINLINDRSGAHFVFRYILVTLVALMHLSNEVQTKLTPDKLPVVVQLSLTISVVILISYYSQLISQSVFTCLEFFSSQPNINLCMYVCLFHQQANEALHHQHQVAQNSLLPLLNAGAEQIDQKPILPIQIDQKPPSSALDLLKDNVASGGGARPPVPVIKKEHKGKTPFVCGYCNKAFRDSYHLRRHESSHTGIKMVSRPKKTAQTAPTMVPMISTMPRDNNGHPSYISTVAGILSTATTSVSSSIMTSSAMGNIPQQNVTKKPAKPVKKNHGCEMCGKAFRDVYHLNRHKLSHSDEKPFECPICQQRFKRKDRMTYHVRSHDGGVHKPYVCSVCGKGFSRYGSHFLKQYNIASCSSEIGVFLFNLHLFFNHYI